MSILLLGIPVAGPYLAAAWAFIASPIGRLITTGTLALAIGFSQGWSIKARMDRSATLQAVVAKQRVDLDAANDTATQANGVAADLSKRDQRNGEIIRDLEWKLSQRPLPATSLSGPCALDDAGARGLRQLR